ncbi:lactonase family protein [Paenibacillus anaericanus]|uniref:Lactonase family protein n=1 Tax=Paenibacillus anaericanus TaxID=170367 RepID=A0A433YEX2_9BACL|nr:lactonase family protein [Paenibacillus anaericanus]RUT48413.1 lactonase family protein [Paenibacillus anaericanus]
MHYQSGKDELLFYVGSYASKDEPSIYLCKLDRRTGLLTMIDSTSGILNPSFLVANNEASHLYVVSEQTTGSVSAYAINPDNGKLSELGVQVMEGADPCHLAITSSGYILISHYSSGHINSFGLNENGALADISSQVQHIGGSGAIADRQEAAHAHSIVPNQEGSYAYVSDLGQDQVVIYALKDGKLEARGEVALPPGTGPRHFVIQESVSAAYGINELNNTITTYAYDHTDGHLEMIQHITTIPEDFTGVSYPADIHLSPDGRYLYGSNRGHDSIVRFAIDPSTGLLSEPKWMGTGGEWPRNFAVLEDYVLVANQNSNNIVAFKRDGDTGTLTVTGSELEIKAPSCIEPLNGGTE